MKGKIILSILETIGDFIVGAADLFEIIATSGYGASHGKIQYELSKRQRERQKQNNWKADKISLKKTERKYQKMISKLKKDGLIKIDVKNNKKFLSLTAKGKDKLKEIKTKKLPLIAYQKEAAGRFIIVAFDIPEKEKNKREWLRAALKNLGLKMVQKSVWFGKIKIPKEFLMDLAKLNLIEFVEIFEITKTGSLKAIA